MTELGNCRVCKKQLQTGFFVPFDDEPYHDDNSVCRSCGEVERRQAPERLERDPTQAGVESESLSISDAQPATAGDSREGDVPGISILLYGLCMLSVLGSFILAAETENPVWLGFMLVQVISTLALASIINYLYSAQKTLKAIERKMSVKD
jgi:hypothetical protein